MLQFTRVATLTGSPRQTMPWATDITEYVNNLTGLSTTCWLATFGLPVGTVIWTTFAESQSTLSEEMMKLSIDDGFNDRVERALEWEGTTPPQDSLREIIHGSPLPTTTGLGSVAQVTRAIALVDRMADAVGWGVEVAEYLEGVIGTSIRVSTSIFGEMGEIQWVGVTPDVAASDAMRAKVAVDPGYLRRLPATKDLFIPGSGRVMQAIRIA